MPEPLFCLDTSVLVKAFVTEEPAEESELAAALLERALTDGRLILPSWAWAEFASVLRKKVHQQLLRSDEAAAAWASFRELPIDFLDSSEIRERAWELADRYDLPTLYDAAFLACCDLTLLREDSTPEFWTADGRFVQKLGTARPAYVKELRR
ncbi:MAG: type II toxin-antitoxin system VapC family toxin [Fimbriimonadales bacterium]